MTVWIELRIEEKTHFISPSFLFIKSAKMFQGKELKLCHLSTFRTNIFSKLGNKTTTLKACPVLALDYGKYLTKESSHSVIWREYFEGKWLNLNQTCFRLDFKSWKVDLSKVWPFTFSFEKLSSLLIEWGKKNAWPLVRTVIGNEEVTKTSEVLMG